MSEETKKKEALQRRQSDTSLSSSTKSSTDVSEGVKKSASFVVYDRHLLKEDLKLTSDADRLCSGMLPIGGKVKRDSLHSSISDPWINPEESISNAIESMLQSCKESPHMNLDQVKEKVSHIYSTVTQAVDSMLANVTVHAQPDAAKHTGLKVKGADEITVKLIDEENLCASQCSLSSPPNTAIGIRERSDSIETNKSSAPQSASSQRSINSPYPGQSCYSKRPGSMHMKKVNDLASHSASTASQRSIQSPEDNKCFSPNDTKVQCMHLSTICMHVRVCMQIPACLHIIIRYADM